MSSINGGGVTGSGIVIKKGSVFEGYLSGIMTLNRYTIPIEVVDTWVDTLQLDGTFLVSYLLAAGSGVDVRVLDKDTDELLFQVLNAAQSSVEVFGTGAADSLGSIDNVLLTDCKIQLRLNVVGSGRIDINMVEL